MIPTAKISSKLSRMLRTTLVIWACAMPAVEVGVRLGGMVLPDSAMITRREADLISGNRSNTRAAYDLEQNTRWWIGCYTYQHTTDDVAIGNGAQLSSQWYRVERNGLTFDHRTWVAHVEPLVAWTPHPQFRGEAFANVGIGPTSSARRTVCVASPGALASATFSSRRSASPRRPRLP